MTKNEVLNKVRVLLGLQKFDKATLADGTVIESDGDFAPGVELYVITEEGDRVPAPEGEHTTESGMTITVDAEGKITGVKRPDEEGEGSLEASEDAEKVEIEKEEYEEAEEEMADDEGKTTVVEAEEEDMGITAEDVLEMVSPLLAEMANMKDDIEKMRKEFEDYMEKPGAEAMTRSFAKQAFNNEAKTESAAARLMRLRKDFIK